LLICWICWVKWLNWVCIYERCWWIECWTIRRCCSAVCLIFSIDFYSQRLIWIIAGWSFGIFFGWSFRICTNSLVWWNCDCNSSRCLTKFVRQNCFEQPGQGYVVVSSLYVKHLVERFEGECSLNRWMIIPKRFVISCTKQRYLYLKVLV